MKDGVGHKVSYNLKNNGLQGVKNNGSDWKWQLGNRVTSIDGLARYIEIDDKVVAGVLSAGRRFRWAITPYYASLISAKDPSCPIRKQAVPDILELDDESGSRDPLHEEDHSPVEGLMHLYPDRVAFCVTSECATYCRHCVRKRFVGNGKLRSGDLSSGVSYIKAHPEIRDVLITGGDPFVGSDEWIEGLISSIRAIEHVEIIRIGTRTPCTLPQRITSRLCGILEKYHPIWVNAQFNHPRELTEESAAACDSLLRAGVPVGNQSVLLRGVNDDAGTMRQLVQGLVKMRVRPYYLYQCEVVEGTKHFRTPVEVGLGIISQLQGYTTGFAVPAFVVDTPIGKVPLSPQNLVARGSDTITLRNYQGKTWVLHCPPLPERGGNTEEAKIVSATVV